MRIESRVWNSLSEDARAYYLRMYETIYVVYGDSVQEVHGKPKAA